MKAFDGIEFYLCGFVVVFAGLVIVTAIDMAIADVEQVGIGEVVSVEYEPSHNSVGFGSGVDSNGNHTQTIQTQHEPEKYVIVVKYNESVFSQEVSPDLYASLEKGSRVRIGVPHGFISDYSYRVMGLEDSE